MKLALAELIDRLVILNLKIWHMEEELRDRSKSDDEIGKITRVLTTINEQRTSIKAEIDEYYGNGMADLKLYRTEPGTSTKE